MDKIKTEENQLPEYKSAIENVSTTAVKLNDFATELKLNSNPLIESGLFSATEKLKNHFSQLHSFHSLLPDIAKIHSKSPALDILRNAAITISGLNSKSPLQEIVESFSKAKNITYQSDIIKSALLGSSLFNSINTPNNSNILKGILENKSLSTIALQSTFTKASALSVYAEKSLLSFPWQDLGQAIKIGKPAKRVLTSRFADLSTDYLNLYKSFEENPISFTELHPSLTKSIPIEYYTGANLLERISTNIDNDDADEELAKDEIIYENEYNLKSFLPKLKPGLLKMWQGAIEAFNSSNTDKVRHFTVSLRELFTQVMYELAPDEEIVKWTQNPDYFIEERPTRKARLHYIYRNISNDHFNKFVDKDVETTLLFIGMFQRGTHSIDNPFTEKQLAGIKSKAESTLKFLLEIHFSTND